MIKKITIWFLCLSVLFGQFSIAEEKFLSLKKSKVNVRYGPSFDSKIKYIYKKINLPIKQIDKKSNSIIILEDKILYKKPSNFSKPIAKLEKGRLLILKKCENIWCNVKTEDYSGWVKTENIWGSVN